MQPLFVYPPIVAASCLLNNSLGETAQPLPRHALTLNHIPYHLPYLPYHIPYHHPYHPYHIPDLFYLYYSIITH